MRFELLDWSVVLSNPCKARLIFESGFDCETLELVDGGDVGELESLCALDGCALECCTLGSSTIDGFEAPTGPSVEPGIEV